MKSRSQRKLQTYGRIL